MNAYIADRDALAKALRATRMVPYDDGEGGTLWRAATADEQRDALIASGAVIDAATLADDEALIADLESRAAWRGDGDYGSLWTLWRPSPPPSRSGVKADD